MQKFLLFLVSIDHFTITEVLYSSGTLGSGKMMISPKNCDVINGFNCSMTSFYVKVYYYHSQMSWMTAGPELSWKGLLHSIFHHHFLLSFNYLHHIYILILFQKRHILSPLSTIKSTDFRISEHISVVSILSFME